MSLTATLCFSIVSNLYCPMVPRCMLCLWRCFCTCLWGFSTGHTWNKTSPSRRNSSQGDVVLYHFGLLGSLVLSCPVESLYTYLIFRDDHILECSWLESCSKVSQYPHLRLVAILSSYLKRVTPLAFWAMHRYMELEESITSGWKYLKASYAISASFFFFFFFPQPKL